MKKAIFVALMLGFAAHSTAQEVIWNYCDLTVNVRAMSKKVTVSVDFGASSKYFQVNTLKDENGKPIVFNSKIDALNHLGEQGWELVSSYAVATGAITVEHYIMKKKFEKE